MDDARLNSSATTLGTGVFRTLQSLLHTSCTLASNCVHVCVCVCGGGGGGGGGGGRGGGRQIN